MSGRGNADLRAATRWAAEQKRAAGLTDRSFVENRVDPKIFRRLQREIPKHDERDLTGRLMGDPQPSRSALGRMVIEPTGARATSARGSAADAPASVGRPNGERRL